MRTRERVAVLEAEVERLSELLLQITGHLGKHQSALFNVGAVLDRISDSQKTGMADIKEMCRHVSQWIESQGGEGWR